MKGCPTCPCLPLPCSAEVPYGHFVVEGFAQPCMPIPALPEMNEASQMSCCRLSAAYFTDKICCEPLTPHLHFSDLRDGQPQYMEQLGRFLHAFATTIKQLQGYYGPFEVESSDTPRTSLEVCSKSWGPCSLDDPPARLFLNALGTYSLTPEFVRFLSSDRTLQCVYDSPQQSSLSITMTAHIGFGSQLTHLLHGAVNLGHQLGSCTQASAPAPC